MSAVRPIPHLPELEAFARVPSPALVFFAEAIAANVGKLVDLVGGHPERLRPHCKTHKCSQIIRMMLSRGITRHKCATLAEAAMLARAGAPDILVSYPVVGPNWMILQNLMRAFAQVRFSCLVDDPEALAAAPQSGPHPALFIDLDGGMGRTGIAWETPAGQAKLRALLDAIQQRGLSLAGLQLYDGHVNQERLEDRQTQAQGAWSRLAELTRRFPELADPNLELVVGGSPSFMAHRHWSDRRVTHSPGTVLLHDQGYGSKYQDMDCFQIAAAVLTRVVSKPGAGRLTLDAGHKAIAADPPLERRAWFPHLADARIVLQNEEHLVIETASAAQVPIGQAFWAIPWHICPTVALHEKAWVHEGGAIVGCWPIDARTRFCGLESAT